MRTLAETVSMNVLSHLNTIQRAAAEQGRHDLAEIHDRCRGTLSLMEGGRAGAIQGELR
jgi:hypothetical protein